ncbi:hypothetical protein CA54_34520 [Symmachiella macrocystis]|uniref:Uncharacterized protein n=1 Tax=Symmachiella macrocystis TaxID=2527985 RepID=A0A5C6BQV2_9PLAN|nr:hypothetical protein [Symmachiella macrocystis]TWU14583.1 hypothetical protein CA54_34520 [Symmachiella macrocystis]
MTTDKEKSRRSWVVYSVLAILVTVGPYVSGYFLLSDSHGSPLSSGICVRDFDHDILRRAFVPMGWIEAKVRGTLVTLWSVNGHDVYYPSR